MLPAIGLILYIAAAYRFALCSFGERLAEVETAAELRLAVLAVFGAPLVLPAGFVLAVAYRMRHTVEAAREFRESARR